MAYLLHAGLLLAACFLYYWVMLRSETHFALNRWVLLGCLLGSLALPLITVPASISLANNLPALDLRSEAVATAPIGQDVEERGTSSEISANAEIGPASTISETIETAAATRETRAEESVSPATAARGPSLLSVLWYVYLMGVLIFGLNFLFQLGQLLVRMFRNPGHDLGGFRLVELREDEAPYSFWNRIFLNPERYDPDTFHQIVEHERIHVNQKHSFDLLLAELTVVVQWCNPFAWLYRKAIEHNLEFLTDAEMLREGNDPERYQLSLVQVAVPNFPNGLVASYNQSFLERRIKMMKSRKSSSRSGWKYLTLLPLLTLSVLQFNAVAQSPAPAGIDTELPVAPAPTPAPSVEVTNTQVAVPEPEVALSPDVAPAPTSVPAAAPKPEPVEMQVTVSAPDNDIRQPNMPENARNTWSASVENDRLCVAFTSRNEDGGNRWNWNTSRCFDKEKFGNLPRTTIDDFTLQREAGTLKMRGVFEGNEGAGTFSFAADPKFLAMLDSRGYGPYKEQEQLLFFMADMNETYLDYIDEQGYRPSRQKLIEMAIFYEDLAELKSSLAAYDRMGFGKPNLQKLIELKIHGVTEEYAEEMAASGFPDLSPKELIDGKIHGVDVEYLKTMAAAGFNDLDFNRAKEMSIHGVTPEYVQEMNQLGYDDISARDILNAKIHGVDAEKIAEFRSAGLTDLTLDEAKNLSIHGVDARFVETLASFGFANLSPQDITNAKIHGLNKEKLNQLKAIDLPMNSLRDLQNASIHGVSSELVAGLRRIGYEDLELKDFVQAKIHGVTPEWAMSFREVGFRDIPFNTLVDLRIHGVTPAFIQERMKEGRTLNDYVKMKIHGL
ncbi:M56 family metallopeptidase [Lewinella sp. 4G2]|uniref:M56 family metallopeptidase n=1 Tax=Lewinella sp. 4G2 TaxID=1803372 RepID=UPI0007B48432|nr:M56 family metallopeptidase [Lewinella sp. 4G2]OAV43350.1 hypothetical protein A3850_002050 [Lewinella sp. 4G2]